MIDEVQTGMGRTGKLWGHEHLGISPDVFTSAKALGGGVPIGAMLCKDSCNVFEPGDHASTYGGNPLACAASLAVTRAIEEESLLNNARERGEQLKRGVETIAKQKPGLIEEVRGWGLMLGVELTEKSGLTAAEVAKLLMQKGVLVVPAGPRVIRFVPPLIISETEVTVALSKFEEAIGTIASN